MLPLPTPQQNNRYSNNAKVIRNKLTEYFHGPEEIL